MWCRFFLILGLSIACATAQSDPAWWSNVIRSGDSHALENNYAPANLGQLKNFADQARLHLNAQLDGGSGTAIESMIAGWTGSLDGNYAPINLGQLKAVADKFYARLDQVGFDYKTQIQNNGYNGVWTSIAGGHERPWNESSIPEVNYAPANIGQVKILFSFDVSGFSAPDPFGDSNGNGLPNGYEGTLGGTGPIGDNDGDGLSNLTEYLQDSNPLTANGTGPAFSATGLLVYTPLKN